MTRRMLILAIAVFGGIVMAALLMLPDDPPHDARPLRTDRGSQAAPDRGSAEQPRADVVPGATDRVRKLSPGDRRQLGERIDRALQRAAASRPSGPPTASGAPTPAAPPALRLEDIQTSMRTALDEAVPLLAECYTKQAAPGDSMTAAAMMTLTSDTELGTVIDTDGITDASGQPIAAALDECLRDTIDSLALPSLGQTGVVKVQYSFRFSAR